MWIFSVVIDVVIQSPPFNTCVQSSDRQHNVEMEMVLWHICIYTVQFEYFDTIGFMFACVLELYFNVKLNRIKTVYSA